MFVQLIDFQIIHLCTNHHVLDQYMPSQEFLTIAVERPTVKRSSVGSGNSTNKVDTTKKKMLLCKFCKKKVLGKSKLKLHKKVCAKNPNAQVKIYYWFHYVIK